ncbi:MAG: hypothetical protein EPO11_05765 [Gammaproteobacteria bacterium]|nr:MAG: hypothetical protein EPO11_05765 [Gammaproteobacteria bacterium]
MISRLHTLFSHSRKNTPSDLESAPLLKELTEIVITDSRNHPGEENNNNNYNYIKRLDFIKNNLQENITRLNDQIKTQEDVVTAINNLKTAIEASISNLKNNKANFIVRHPWIFSQYVIAATLLLFTSFSIPYSLKISDETKQDTPENAGWFFASTLSGSVGMALLLYNTLGRCLTDEIRVLKDDRRFDTLLATDQTAILNFFTNNHLTVQDRAQNTPPQDETQLHIVTDKLSSLANLMQAKMDDMITKLAASKNELMSYKKDEKKIKMLHDFKMLCFSKFDFPYRSCVTPDIIKNIKVYVGNKEEDYRKTLENQLAK